MSHSSQQSPRFYFENPNPNNKIYRESEVKQRVSLNATHLRPVQTQGWNWNWATEGLVEEDPHHKRVLNHSNETNMKNRRFPMLKVMGLTPDQSQIDDSTISKQGGPSAHKRAVSFESPTLASSTKQRVIIEPAELSMSKSAFKPVNMGEAKNTLVGNVFVLQNDYYLTKREADMEERHAKRDKMLFGKFIPNTKSPAHLEKTTSFVNSQNDYVSFLKKKEEVPRLSILENYKQISRIMRNSFLKSKEYEVRIKNNTMTAEEMTKKNEEDETTKKMTAILKQMNSPRNTFAGARRTSPSPTPSKSPT